MKYPDIQICLNTSDNDLDREFFIPCLKWAQKYDRGVGYFTSGWISKNSIGLAEFASNGGKARWLTSPILAEKDYQVLSNAKDMYSVALYFNDLMTCCISRLAEEIAKDALNALGWMIYDNILEFKFAIPTLKLRDGDFHDKFGLFYDGSGNSLSFSGSINDSSKGFSNYESIKIFKSWEGMSPYINADAQRFERLWNNRDDNLQVLECSDVIREELIKLRIGERPYDSRSTSNCSKMWQHQDNAVKAFIDAQNGILEMATGTGKTRTALRIISQLLHENKIVRVIITMHGNDLLRQWEKEVLSALEPEIRVFRYFDSCYKELPSFLLCKSKCILIVSRDADRLSECINYLKVRMNNSFDETMFVFDEVHGLGAKSLRLALSDKISKFKYRLGLSATPDREYDDAGNRFILQEVGPIIFKFSIEDAIKQGILCEFSYFPIEYELTIEEKRNKRDIIAKYSARRKSGEIVNDEDMYRDLARVNKTSVAKLPLFHAFILQMPSILERCIIFVETKDYGVLVQNIIIQYIPEFHTYYSEDDEDNLKKFGNGTLNCLITCKKISEGVDIKSVKNIILFSSDKGRLVTTQRIGRSLRINPQDPQKRANVVDFICINPDSVPNEGENSADSERRAWLEELSKIRRNS
jgi:superfamily II DNA or RNA helicase